MKVDIIPYQSEYRDELRRLNEAWLTRYFFVEPRDVQELGDPERLILQPGGYIYFARAQTGIVGVAALMKVRDGVYELSKMAVDEASQGRGIGRQLAEACLQKAREWFARQVVLYTNHRLVAAVSLYRDLGFVEVDMGYTHYQRADMKMELDLFGERHRNMSFMNTRFWYR